MRLETSVTSLSWIPSEAITGSMQVAFDLGLGHYDDPPPDALVDPEALRDADRFRFATVSRVAVETDGDAHRSTRLRRAAG